MVIGCAHAYYLERPQCRRRGRLRIAHVRPAALPVCVPRSFALLLIVIRNSDLSLSRARSAWQRAPTAGVGAENRCLRPGLSVRPGAGLARNWPGRMFDLNEPVRSEKSAAPRDQ